MTIIDPLLFLGGSILLVAVSLTALVVAAFPAIQDLSRAARSAEKLFDRLDRELPPTLEAIRLASLELSDLSEEMSQGVQSAAAVAQQVDLSLVEVKKQAGNIQTGTRSVWVGVQAAWQTWRASESDPRRQMSATVRVASLEENRASLPASVDDDEFSAEQLVDSILDDEPTRD